ncbi:MAG: hypothetical protein O2812_06280 [Chloroflexi bacterium]|nr:hypothetical protein [Chloroflexota bacterium]
MLAACTQATPTPTSAPAPTSTPLPTPTSTQEPTTGPAQLTLSSDAQLGSIITDSEGMVLYLFTNDERETSNCSGGCANAWPPLITEGDASVGEGLDSNRLGTITRDDGSTQVTYNGWPLYYFARDEKPGDATGQAVNDVWWLVSANGGPIYSTALVTTSVHPELGTVLSDATGRILYLFTNDEPNTSNCSGGCAGAWPPLLTVEDPSAGEGVTESLLGVISRGDGTKQVTYNGWPLYYYPPDEKPGDATGQAVNDVWWVVDASGEAVQ